MAHAYGHIEGKGFAVQCISEMLNVHILIWNVWMRDISLIFYSLNTSSKFMYLLHLPMSTSHAHFYELLQISSFDNINHS